MNSKEKTVSKELELDFILVRQLVGQPGMLQGLCRREALLRVQAQELLQEVHKEKQFLFVVVVKLLTL